MKSAYCVRYSHRPKKVRQNGEKSIAIENISQNGSKYGSKHQPRSLLAHRTSNTCKMRKDSAKIGQSNKYTTMFEDKKSKIEGSSGSLSHHSFFIHILDYILVERIILFSGQQVPITRVTGSSKMSISLKT